MDEELKGIVQRMIDAGETEANIATVIQSWNSKKKDQSKVSGQGSASGSEISGAPALNFQAPEIPQIGGNFGANLTQPSTFGDIAAQATPQETIEQPAQQSRLKDWVDSVERGSVAVGTMLSGLPEFLYEQTGLGDYEQAIAATGPMSGLSALSKIKDFYAARNVELSNRITQYEDGIVDSAMKGNLADAGAQLLNTIGESITPMLLMATTGGVGGAGAAGTALSATGGALPQSVGRAVIQNAVQSAPRVAATALPFASGRWQEIKNDPNVPDEIKPLVAWGSGFSEIIYEGGFGSARLIRRIADGAIKKEGVNRFVKGFLDKAVESTGVPASAFRGAVSEMSTSLTNNIIDKYSGVDPDRDLYEGVKDAAVTGFTMDAAIATPSAVSRSITNNSERRQAAQLSESNNQILADLSNPEVNLTPDQRSVLMDKYNQNTDAIESYINKSEQERAELTPRQREIQQDLINRSEALNEVMNNEALSDLTRQEAENELQQVQERLDRQVEIDDAITEFQRNNPDIEVDFMEDLSDYVVTTFERVESGLPVDPVALDEASSWMYGKYKELSDMKESDNRRMTIEQIDSMQEQLELDITTLENYRSELQNEADREPVRQEEPVQPETPVDEVTVSEQQSAEPVAEQTEPVAEEVTTVTEPQEVAQSTETTEEVETPTETIEAVTEPEITPTQEEQPTVTSSVPEEGSLVSLPPRIEGGPQQNFEYSEGEWKQRVGRELVEVSPTRQQQVNDEFNTQQNVTPTESTTKQAVDEPTTGPVAEAATEPTQQNIQESQQEGGLDAVQIDETTSLPSEEQTGAVPEVGEQVREQAPGQEEGEGREQVKSPVVDNPKLKELIKDLPRQDLSSVRGPANVEYRQDILEAITGERPPKSKAGINVVQKAVHEYLGVQDAGSDAARADMVREWANSEQSVTPEPASAPVNKAGDSLRSLADKIRQAKITKPADLRNLKGSTLFDVAWDGALETAATTLEATGKVADAVQAAVRALKDSEWYKGLSDDSKSKAESALRDTINPSSERETAPEPKKTRMQQVSEASRATVVPNSPTELMPKPSNPSSFVESAHQDITNAEQRETVSNILRESGEELTQEQKEYRATSIRDALNFGTQVVENAKIEFGDTYVSDILKNLRDNAATISTSNRSLITIALELDLERLVQNNPKNVTFKKQLALVRNISIEQQRQAAIGVGYGRLRQIARVGYDLSLITDQFFTAAEVRGRNKVIEAVESDMDAINEEAAEMEESAETTIDQEAIEAAVMEEVTKQVDAMYEKLPSARKKAADRAIAALDKFQSKIRSKAYSDVTGMVAIVDSGITTIKAAIRAGVAVADAIELGINRINDRLQGKKWKEDEFRKDMMDGFKDAGIKTDEGKRVSKKTVKTPDELLEEAKQRIRERIADRRKTIDEKKVELTARNKPFTEDAEYASLVAEEKELKELQKQFLTPESKDLINERKKKAIVSKIENDIAALDKQIAKGEKDATTSTPSMTDAQIEGLKAQKKAKSEVLESIDPNPKKFAKQALIDAGYGRTVNIKGEERQILDWKKLAGEEGSYWNIEETVEKALRESGFSDSQIARMKPAFSQEYHDIRASIIEKSLNELNRQNKKSKPVETRSSAQRLAELYNLGLFDQNMDTYDHLINKAIGLGGMTQEQFFEAKDLAAALSDLYKYSGGNEVFIKHAVRDINHKISSLLNKVAFGQSNWKYRTVSVVAEYLNLNLRNKLQTVKQMLENPISGYQEVLIQEIGGLVSGRKIKNRDLIKQRRKIASIVAGDIINQGGLYYGEVNTPFLTKSRAEEWLLSLSPSRFYQVVISGMLGKTYLEGADSLFKANLTEKNFVQNLVKILTDPSHPNPMTKDEAVRFVSEQRTGQKFEEAVANAKTIIEETNRKYGKPVLTPTHANAVRIAMDLVNANLMVGEAVTPRMIEASYRAAYRTAGYGLGHEANNFLSTMVNYGSSFLEGKTKAAIKNKEWDKAAMYTAFSTVYRNFMNPFVGGGTNWLWLGIQKTGFDVISPVQYWIESKGGIDLSTPEGIKDLDKKLYADQNFKAVMSRVLIGAVSSAVVAGLVAGTDWDDDYYEWLEKNRWAKKYAGILTPTMWGAIVSAKNQEMSDWFGDTFNRGAQFDAVNNIAKAMRENEKGTQYGNDVFWGQIGYEAGTNLSVPVIPWRMARDLGGIYNGITDDPRKNMDFKNIGLYNGFFNYGMMDLLGMRPDRSYRRDVANIIPDSDRATLELIRDHDIATETDSNKEMAIDGGIRGLTHAESKVYDDKYAKEFYAILKDNKDYINSLPKKEAKEFVSDARSVVRMSAQSTIGAYDKSLSEITVDGTKYVLPPEVLEYRHKMMERYKRENKSALVDWRIMYQEQGIKKPWAELKAKRRLETKAREHSRDMVEERYKKQLIEKE